MDDHPPSSQQQQQDLSSGSKIGIGCSGFVGVALPVLILIVAILQPDEDSENLYTMTAIDGGTTANATNGDIYTVVKINIKNEGSRELDVDPIEFSAELEDGNVVDQDTRLVKLENSLEDVTLNEGQKTEGNIVFKGDMSIATVTMDRAFRTDESITVDVQKKNQESTSTPLHQS